MSAAEDMHRIDTLLSHVWMVRTFLKHSDEAQDDEELAEVHRELYDYMLALGNSYKEGDAATYLKTASKKLAKLRRITDVFREIQPDVSAHMNFQMAERSLTAAVAEIAQILAGVRDDG
jgi:cob(I)alamin adenosyltransferase